MAAVSAATAAGASTEPGRAASRPAAHRSWVTGGCVRCRRGTSALQLGLKFAVVHGLNQSNAAGLMALTAPDTIPPAVLVEGLALHLDVTDCPEETAFQAWRLLADTVSALAGALVSLRIKVSLHVTLLWACFDGGLHSLRCLISMFVLTQCYTAADGQGLL